MEFNEETRTFSYPCPCGDKFLITEEQLMEGEEIARCPSCSLIIRVIYDLEEATSEPPLESKGIDSPQVKAVTAC